MKFLSFGITSICMSTATLESTVRDGFDASCLSFPVVDCIS